LYNKFGAQREKRLEYLAVGNTRKKPVIGILGGICSGKSTVAAELAKLGCKVIDADKIAHKLLEQNFIKNKIVKHFGHDVIGRNGRIDRKKLADIVFSNEQKLSLLNGIIHPFVLERFDELIRENQLQSKIPAIVLDMPLLVEVGWENRCDYLIFVDCCPKTRLERAKRKGILQEEQIKIRENFQISLDNKRTLADNIIDNNSSLSALVKQITDIFFTIMSKT
jgi:dephospho-CoA kinase